MVSLSTRAAEEAPAQQGVGAISGKVIDRDSRAVDKARVVAFSNANANNQLVAETKTEADGTFTLTKVPEGNVRLFVQKKNMGEAHVEEVIVVAGKETKLTEPLALVLKNK
ncbi:MAG: carboxypeptidase-like regulatory domain-containing protein [Phycisphaerae bacterium]